jgi:hypothetical protein
VFLVGTPANAADALRPRRDTRRISQIIVSTIFFQQLTPLVELLAGR